MCSTTPHVNGTFRPSSLDVAWFRVHTQLMSTNVCRHCHKPHRVDLSGPLCHDCRLAGVSVTVEPTQLVKVTPGHKGQGIVDSRYGWESHGETEPLAS